ncbi:MAG: hypothetical protein FWG98_08180 [Candidatus Cloacimonetes bacterium]|nr:hypothetical protein [Candidatus Cloacimonadota bacterium]
MIDKIQSNKKLVSMKKENIFETQYHFTQIEIATGQPLLSSRSSFLTEDCLDNKTSDFSIMKQINHILFNNFKNGLKINDDNVLKRFKNDFSSTFHIDFIQTDEDLRKLIISDALVVNDRVHYIPAEIKDIILNLALSFFNKGGKIIYIKEFYDVHFLELHKYHINVDLLRKIFFEYLPDLYFHIGFDGIYAIEKSSCKEELSENGDAVISIISEIERIWGEETILSISEIKNRLPYIPQKLINDILQNNSAFILNAQNEFIHIAKVNIFDEDVLIIKNQAKVLVDTKGYFLFNELPLEIIKSNNMEISEQGIERIVFNICLAEKYVLKGSIMSSKEKGTNLSEILRNYCESKDECTLNELVVLKEQIVGKNFNYYRHPLDIALKTMVRINVENFVSDRMIRFDTIKIDEEIRKIVINQYLPLKSFISINHFSDCGYQWNLFLLESFVRRFSKIFSFDAPDVNSKNAGVIKVKKCKMTYLEIMTDAVIKAKIALNEDTIQWFLQSKGYSSKKINRAKEIIDTIQQMRET